MEFKSVPKAILGMTELLEKEGKKVFIERIGEITKEIVGVSFVTQIKGFEKFLKNRGAADMEIDEGFLAARKILLDDPTARYAVGHPFVRLDESRPSCLVSIQILQREIPKIICYFRSSNITEISGDLARIAQLTFKEFGEGEIIFFIGSLHKDIRTD